MTADLAQKLARRTKVWRSHSQLSGLLAPIFHRMSCGMASEAASERAVSNATLLGDRRTSITGRLSVERLGQMQFLYEWEAVRTKQADLEARMVAWAEEDEGRPRPQTEHLPPCSSLCWAFQQVHVAR